MSEYVVFILFVIIIYIFLSLRKEKKRVRVLASFIGGLIGFVSKAPSNIGETTHEEVGRHNGYEVILKEIGNYFEEDFWTTPYEKFVKLDRNLFWEEKLRNGGFNQVFLDFHDKCLKEWYAIKHNDDVNMENNEVLGEKLIYQDYLDNNTEKLKNVRLPKNPRLFFKHLTEEEIQKIEARLNVIR